MRIFWHQNKQNWKKFTLVPQKLWVAISETAQSMIFVFTILKPQFGILTFGICFKSQHLWDTFHHYLVLCDVKFLCCAFQRTFWRGTRQFGCPQTPLRLSTLPLMIPKCKTCNGKSMGMVGTPVSIPTPKRLICGIPRSVLECSAKLYLLFLEPGCWGLIIIACALGYFLADVFVHYLDRAYHNVEITLLYKEYRGVLLLTVVQIAVSVHFYGYTTTMR